MMRRAVAFVAGWLLLPMAPFVDSHVPGSFKPLWMTFLNFRGALIPAPLVFGWLVVAAGCAFGGVALILWASGGQNDAK